MTKGTIGVYTLSLRFNIIIQCKKRNRKWYTVHTSIYEVYEIEVGMLLGYVIYDIKGGKMSTLFTPGICYWLNLFQCVEQSLSVLD